MASFNHPDRERKPGSIGTPIEGVEMKLVDEDGDEVAPGEVGEIAIRGHNVMKGYWSRPEATAEAIARRLVPHRRHGARSTTTATSSSSTARRSMIIRGGYNVYPREIEEVLYEHPAVREAAVIGDPARRARRGGRRGGRAEAGTPRPTADELRAFVKERVAAYKYPRQVWFVDELPKGPTGKILKREIKPPVVFGSA